MAVPASVVQLTNKRELIAMLKPSPRFPARRKPSRYAFPRGMAYRQVNLTLINTFAFGDFPNSYAMLEHQVAVFVKLLAHFPVPRALCLAFDQARKLIGFKSAFCDDDICVGNPESSTIRHVLAIPQQVGARQPESDVLSRMRISAMRFFHRNRGVFC